MRDIPYFDLVMFLVLTVQGLWFYGLGSELFGIVCLCFAVFFLMTTILQMTQMNQEEWDIITRNAVDLSIDQSYELSEENWKIIQEMSKSYKQPNLRRFRLKSQKRSRFIKQNVKDQVWRRDEGKCTICGTQENLEFDHIIPFSKGGMNTYRNLQLLCQKCNSRKSDKIR